MGSQPYVLEKIVVNFKTLLKVHSGLDNKVDWSFFKDINGIIGHRTKVYGEFIDNHQIGKDKTYIKADLPHLPFKNDEFSLVLCSHLLFL